MRITGGVLKGRKIILLKRGDVRYTSSKVREAIFNMLGDVAKKTVLDLFAGSGSFTIEALSRGASSATCVEVDGEMAGILTQNLTSLDLRSYSDIVIMDVFYAIPFLSKKALAYDIVFMDPPYERGYIAKAMELLKTYKVCGATTILVMEHSKRETQTASDLEGWRKIASKGYGDTVVTLLEADQITDERSIQ